MTGLDILVSEDFARLHGKSVGLVMNQASVTRDCRHALDVVLPYHRSGKLNIVGVFGPQHGLFGHTQDNMIEWEAEGNHRSGLPIHSLYGERREPTAEMLDGVEVLVVDLQDVGARYYTFIWTMALCIKACSERGIPVMVLDRPNPIGGILVEGTVGDPDFASFVGLHPLPMRHGMTIGEIACHLRTAYFPRAEIEVVQMTGWSRSDYFSDTDLPWSMPSPNMPTVDTAVVYPGGCLLEATNMSEGRGTTRPFEIFGASWLDGWKYCEALNDLDLPGCVFRPLEFEPTFHKFAKEVCEGAFLHVTDRHAFEPVLAYVAVMQEAIRQAGDQFEWKEPPYEYEYEKLPIDILNGNSWLREEIEGLTPLNRIRQRFLEECSAFEPMRDEALLYPSSA
jgi:uncharacterized protein YbbC (DUF1343 family)